MTDVLGFRQDTLVERDPGQLAIDEAVGRERVGDRAAGVGLGCDCGRRAAGDGGPGR